MKTKPIMLACAAAILGTGASFMAVTSPGAAAMPVFDVTNYSQNLLQAARALDQINNQISSLQNEAAMLQNMGKNLSRVDFPELQQVRSALQRIDQLMGEARGIDFRVDQLDSRIRSTFPGVLERALTRDEQLAQARGRLDAARASYQQAMRAQAQVVENVGEDAQTLAGLAARSQSAEGALQVGQAANQLLALSVKQQLQLQSLMAAEYRSASIERARRVQAEEDGRAATRRFLGVATSAPPRR